MIITATRKDDILRDKQEYESRVDDYNARKSQLSRRRMNEDAEVFDAVKAEIMSGLSKFDLLDFDVRVSENWQWGDDPNERKGLEVRVECGSVNHSPLAWEYKAEYTTLGVKQETSSWSGLSATTKEELDYLKQTVGAIEYLQSLDWDDLTGRSLKPWSEYQVDEPAPKTDRNFDFELMEAEIDEIIGTNKALCGKASAGTGYREGTEGFYLILSETPKQYEVVFVHNNFIDQEGTYEAYTKWGGNKIRKSTLFSHLDKPINIVDIK